jgi:hypothetical protein
LVVFSTNEEGLQGSSFNSCLFELPCGAGGRGEALNFIILLFCGAAEECEGGGLARAGEALDSITLFCA